MVMALSSCNTSQLRCDGANCHSYAPAPMPAFRKQACSVQ